MPESYEKIKICLLALQVEMHDLSSTPLHEAEFFDADKYIAIICIEMRKLKEMQKVMKQEQEKINKRRRLC